MIGCIIQARMNSSRLPGKVMMKIDGEHPLLYFVIKQLQSAKLLSKIIIATTTNPSDDIIVKYAKKLKIDYFCGDENDVLDRYYQCANKFNLSSIVRIPSDKPLIDPNIVDHVIEIFQKNSFDYVTNFLPLTYPSGTEVEVFSMDSLKIAWENAHLSSEREHVTPYIYNNPNKFKIFNVKNSKDLSKFRWAVDRIEDLELVRKLVSRIKERPILTSHILNQINNDPKLFEINKDVDYFEGLTKSLEKDKLLDK